MQENSDSTAEIIVERKGQAGFITLNRPNALNALNLQMVREITIALNSFVADSSILLVAIRGMSRATTMPPQISPFGLFCAGGDIKFFHSAAISSRSELDAFFTEEYSLNHLIQKFPKPLITFLDGIVMGGGMGLCQGSGFRIVTPKTKMAMPETKIGLFPDVGGGYFLSRCPGHSGEYLALTGQTIGAEEAIGFGLADLKLDSSELPALWSELGEQTFLSTNFLEKWLLARLPPDPLRGQYGTEEIDKYFRSKDVHGILCSLKASKDPWALNIAETLHSRSPLMLQVTLEQIRRARSMNITEELHMERVMIYWCFKDRAFAASEAIEGIRALVIDKDKNPQWWPSAVDKVTPGMVDEFFKNPWVDGCHPLANL